MDAAAWGALTLTLTLLGAIWTWRTFQRRGVASGLRAAAFTLLPVAAYLTKTLQLFTTIVEAVAHWATNLVFNPLVWGGVVLAGLSVVLFGASRVLRTRDSGRAAVDDGGRPGRKQLPTSSTGAKQGKGAPAIDDDLAEIEALLRKRGIT